MSYYARVTYLDQTGTTTQYQYAFVGGGELSIAHVFVYINSGAGWVLKEKTDATYGWSIDGTTKIVTFDTAPGSPGSEVDVRIRRITPVTMIVDFAAGTLTEDDLDNDSKQARYLVQENLDYLSDVMMISDIHGQWDGEHEGARLRAQSFADATANDHLTTLGQVVALIGDGGNAALNTPFYVTGIGDGLTKEFDLRALTGDDDINCLTEKQMFIWVGGHHYGPDDFSISSGYIIVLDSTPAYGDEYAFAWYPATIMARYQADLVDTLALCDNAVTAAKILDGAVGTSELATNAVTTVKITDDAVTAAKIADDAVATAQILDEAVTEPKVADGINKDPTITNILSGQTMADLVWDDNGGAGFQNTADKLILITLFIYTTTNGVRRYDIEISAGSSFSTAYKQGTVSTGESDGPDHKRGVLQAWVPDDWYWRIKRIDGNEDTGASALELTRMKITH